MEQGWIPWLFVAEIALLTALGFALPRMGRLGLLFGAYVGDASSKPEAAAIRRRWDRGIVIAGALAVAAAVALAIVVSHPIAAMAPMLPLGGAMFVLYLKCHREAKALGAHATPSPSASQPSSPVAVASNDPLPWISLALGITGGAIALVYAIQSYDAMPARVPIHFGLTGKPDGWAARSIGSVFIAPLLTIVMAIVVGGSAVLTARTSLSVRADGVSLEAQQRFRRAVARFLAVVAIITSTMITTLSIFTTRTAIGASPGLPPWSLAFAGVLVLYTVVGAIYLMTHYGQGGARLDVRMGAAPVPDALADDRFWKLGVFYVNPEDPSWLVEKRFGFGYTMNFGNRAALWTCGTAFLVLVVLSVWAVASI